MLINSMTIASRAARYSLAALALLAATPRAHAAQCPTPAAASSALSQHDDEARLRFVRDSLRETARRERRFALAWGLTYVGLAGGTWLLLPFSNDPGQVRLSGFNTATSLAGGGLAILTPLLTARDHTRLEELLSQPQSASSESRCAVLFEAERLLAHAAKLEESVNKPLTHISNLGVSLGLGLFIAYVLKMPSSAPLNTAMGIILGELGAATRPTYARRSLERYQQGVLSAPPPTSFFSVVPLFSASNSEYRVALGGTF